MVTTIASSEKVSIKSLIGIRDLPTNDVLTLLRTAQYFSLIEQQELLEKPWLKGIVVANIFFEPSTRTALSFEMAAKRLNAQTISFAAASSSLSKGETLADTVRNIYAMSPDIIVMRHALDLASEPFFKDLKCSIVNAGDGRNEHPTQALLDVLTIANHFQRPISRDCLKGLRLAIIGDIKHSRVAHSNMLLWRMLGADVVICGPEALVPEDIQSHYDTLVAPNTDDALKGVDVVMVLRIQKERLETTLQISDEEYHLRFGLHRERVAQLPSHAVVMHAGPINRGIEIASEIADGPRSLILQQTRYGVFVRMAVLYCLRG